MIPEPKSFFDDPSLSADAQLALRHWFKYRPQMYEALWDSGELITAAKLASDRTFELTDQIHNQLLQSSTFADSGAAWEEAKAISLKRFILLPLESDVPQLERDGLLYFWDDE